VKKCQLPDGRSRKREIYREGKMFSYTSRSDLLVSATVVAEMLVLSVFTLLFTLEASEGRE
jgi:hypothetical protein